MSDFGAIYHTFWTGRTGKDIKSLGDQHHARECQVIAVYLMTCKHRNAIGLYYLPIVLLSHETGIPFEGASKGLRSLFRVGFCSYDEETEFVWVHEMANYQLGEIKPKDKRVKWINKLYNELPKNPFLEGFFEKYGDLLKLEKARAFEGASKGHRRGIEGPSKPYTDTDTCTNNDFSTKSPAGPESPPQPDPSLPGAPDGDLPFQIPDPDKKKNRHFSNIVGTNFKAIKSACDQISKYPQMNGKRFNPYQWVQKHVNERRHPGAISEAITAMADPNTFQGIRGDPFAYGNSILKTKNQNYNEKEAIAIHNHMKAISGNELTGLTFGMLKEV